MKVKLNINGKIIQEDIQDDLLLIDFLRNHGFYSVKRGCETSNCGLCTVWMDEKPILSCGMLVARADGHRITTLEGLTNEAKEFADFMAHEGVEQCGFCSPGLIMNVLAMDRELDHPSVEEINHYLAGNLCRCSGYMGQTRAILKYLQRNEVSNDEIHQ